MWADYKKTKLCLVVTINRRSQHCIFHLITELGPEIYKKREKKDTIIYTDGQFYLFCSCPGFILYTGSRQFKKKRIRKISYSTWMVTNTSVKLKFLLSYPLTGTERYKTQMRTIGRLVEWRSQVEDVVRIDCCMLGYPACGSRYNTSRNGEPHKWGIRVQCGRWVFKNVAGFHHFLIISIRNLRVNISNVMYKHTLLRVECGSIGVHPCHIWLMQTWLKVCVVFVLSV